MIKTSVSFLKKEIAALPIARIETMDESYVLPLREYLITNGCQVFVNNGPTENVTYFFVAGDSNFVKKTLAFRHTLGKKRLVLCWDPEDHTSIEQFLERQTKIVYIDPVPLTHQVLTDIFIFLFTASGKEMDIQTHAIRSPHKHTYGDVQEPSRLHAVNGEADESDETPFPASSAYESIQKKRITTVITDLFGGKRSESPPAKNSTYQEDNDKTQAIGKAPDLRSHITYLILATLLVAVIPFFLYLAAFGIRSWSLLQGISLFREGKAREVAARIRTEHVWSGYSHLVMPLVHAVLRIPMGDRGVQAFERMDKLLDVVAEIETELLAVNSSVLSLGSSLLISQSDGKPPAPIVAVDALRKSVPSVRIKLNLASAHLTSLKNSPAFPLYLPYVQKQIEKAHTNIDTLRQIAEVGERISQLYPFIGGFREKQHVLILLQNSSELRPTGGFIGSLAHLTISEGVLEEIRVEDIYTLDGQLKGHVDPPLPIRELLTQEHWYLRDSNWNPDFQKTAETAGFFYEKETGEKIDSIVAVTSSLIVRLLKIIGPVDIPSFNDRITADNFYLKSHYYTQANFFPGSTQKKDFLGGLMEAILQKVKNNPQSGIAIMGIIHDSLASKDIQLYVANPEGEEIVQQFGWGGKTPAGSTCIMPENQPSCQFSYVYINEANMSINKVNAFIDRSDMRLVRISEDGKISETVTRKIQNQSRGETGTGVYTTYVRLFFPIHTTLTRLTLDEKPLPMKDAKDLHPSLPYAELDTSIPGLIGISVALSVDPERERIISATVSYDKPILVDTKETFVSVFTQKQAGIDQISLTTTIQYPLQWEAIPFPGSNENRMVAKQGYLEYNTSLSMDSEFTFRLVR